MEYIGFEHTTAALILLVIALISKSVYSSPLVVKKKYVSPDPRDDGAYIEVAARKSGLTSWVLSLFGIDPTYSIKVYLDRLEYQKRSISEFRSVVVPVNSVSSAYFGYNKPWIIAILWLLIFQVIAYAVGFQMRDLFSNTLIPQLIATLIAIAGFGVSVLVFIFNRQMLFGYTEAGSLGYALMLKRSAIEGLEIDEDTLETITKIIIAILRERQQASDQNG